MPHARDLCNKILAIRTPTDLDLMTRSAIDEHDGSIEQPEWIDGRDRSISA